MPSTGPQHAILSLCHTGKKSCASFRAKVFTIIIDVSRIMCRRRIAHQRVFQLKKLARKLAQLSFPCNTGIVSEHLVIEN